MRARVLIRPKQGILDPQGLAVAQALPVLGFEGVADVHVGRMVELDLPDPDRLTEMCERLLANPLVEDYEIELLADPSESGPPADPNDTGPPADPSETGPPAGASS